MDGMVHNNGSYSSKHALCECKNETKVVYLYEYIKGKCELTNELCRPND